MRIVRSGLCTMEEIIVSSSVLSSTWCCVMGALSRTMLVDCAASTKTRARILGGGRLKVIVMDN
jgi:hypothetical protein